ncbi:MAG: hypothetical protein BRC38_16810 [Cyanobacteria bacterium QH_6_48_35]|jgi:hypothetical protein|nr:MAG: hypothetical protein BRC34_01120 [Cyanobacteria bacterium QH_1_48_107]PSO62051.1 MAG: hypothetical protein BRC38_16810 [Cyanobacteria bacterium QH_6_48_35]PSO67791.1 MAG: hypothetical protein BRC39_00965 [Cyanobacteria bacterium QH_7_48_89]
MQIPWLFAVYLLFLFYQPLRGKEKGKWLLGRGKARMLKAKVNVTPFAICKSASCLYYPFCPLQECRNALLSLPFASCLTQSLLPSAFIEADHSDPTGWMLILRAASSKRGFGE